MRLKARLHAAAALTVTATASVMAAVPVTASALPAATASTTGGAGHAAAVTISQQRAVLRYWTPSRMEHAVPLGPATSVLRAAAGAITQPVAGLVGAGLVGTGLLGAGPAASPPRPAALGSLVPPLEFLAAPARVAPMSRVAPVAPAGRASRGARLLRAAGGGRTTGAPWTGGGAIARTTGKIFFTLGGTDYVCSGAVVASANADVTVTAGHCVSDGNGNWATNWTFVPGYSNGSAPYGSYPARRYFVAGPWTSSANEDYDVAFVALNTASVGGTATHVGSAVGGLGVAFGTQPGRVDAFGYPAEPPYSGEQLYYCAGGTSPDPYHATSDTGLNCAMTEGSSGGPWLSGFNGSTGIGTVTSVSSFKYDDGTDIMYGTSFGASAKSLYQQAAHA
jgi:V8-like Glu-specific endopeptidase